ncbi:hypothetical protein ACA910_019617 [Epithemia clementina (nom. ined.)]
MCKETQPETMEYKPADEPSSLDVPSSPIELVEPKERSPVESGNGDTEGDKRPKLPQTGADLGVWEKSLEDQSGLLSNWTMFYLTPFLGLGARKVLDADDMGVPSEEDRADAAYIAAAEAWKEQVAKTAIINEKIKRKHEAKMAKCKTEEERKKLGEKPQLKDPSLSTAIAKAFGTGKVVIATLYYLASAFLGFVPVLMLNKLVSFFESGQSIKESNEFPSPWGQVAVLGIVPVIVTVLATRNQLIMAHCATFVRTAVSTLLFRKSLRVSAAGRAKTSTGQVVNMMSNDTAQLQRFLQFFGMIVGAPFQIVLALALIYREVGNATWVGVGYMILLAPVNVFIFSIVSKQRRKVLKYSDLRVKMTNEILGGIRIIKFYAWERPFGREIGQLRASEMKALTKLAYTTAVGFSLILMATPLIQPILVFATYVSIQDEPLTAAKAFTTVALFNIMRFPFAFLPMGLLQFIQSRIAVGRIERYLDLPELGEYVQTTPPPGSSPDSPSAMEGSITVVDGSFSWVDPSAGPIREVNETKPKKKDRRRSSRHSFKSTDGKTADAEMSVSVRSAGSRASVTTDVSPKEATVTLRNLNFSIEAGNLVAVVGEVGSGKSSFLSAILGEMESINNSKVYIPRTTQSDTKEHEGAVLSAAEGFVSYCAQTPWVVNDTLRGNILFGREFDEERYNEVVEACALVDDIVILPAGDMTEIGERGINLSGGQKARVSLARAFYSKKTKVMLMDDPLSAVDAHVGEHIFSRAINGPLGRGVTRVLVTHHVHLLSRCDSVIVLDRGTIKHEGKYKELLAQGVTFAGAVDVSKAQEESGEDVENLGESKEEVLTDEKKAALKKSGAKLVSTEERQEGSVDGSAYLHYARAGGITVAFSAIFVSGIGRASEIMSGFWLAFWAERSLTAKADGDPHSFGTTYRYLGIYALFGVFGVVCLSLRAVVIAIHRLRASRKLHDNLAESIIRAPIAFFDVTPIGRILNRFAADMDKIDLELTQTLSQGMSTVFNVLGAVGAIVAATKGTLLAPLIPMGWIYYVVQKWFRKTSTELQRLTSIANSPIFADFSQTLSGTSSIRAYGSEHRFFEQCKKSFDAMNASYVLVQLTNLWLGLRLDILGGILSTLVAVLALATYKDSFIPAGWLGLALSYSIEISTYLKHGVRMLATLEAQMSSVERILYYSEKIEPEADEYLPEKDPIEGTWPVSGDITIQNASMRYRDGPLVLKDLTLNVKGGERVGIAGRTGSGKSSLMVCLFRVSEIENDGGKIFIDGVDITQIGLTTLRSNISIIPQDPIVFSNTVRYNLDPFKKATDEEIWDTLQKVQMDEVIAALPGGLEEQVAEGGENFSQGQRQLLCIARSLLRKPKILFMDEATASIDNTTDASIQKMIRENFAGATVLTIAHRLNTIMDSDKVIVFDSGRIAEYDSPQVLLRKENGLFRGMVEKSRAAEEHKDDD